jgi:alpha-L-rhamnosidase
MVTVYDVQFEHYLEPNTLGLDEREPRISWKLDVADGEFEQSSYEVEVARRHPGQTEWVPENVIRVDSPSSKLVAWPCEASLTSREQVRVRISVHDGQRGRAPSWSQPIDLETGLLERSDWVCHRIAAPWKPKLDGPDPEQLFRRAFRLTSDGIAQARLYITAQGVYEAEINGNKVGDYFLAPGWTTYNHRLQYQTYDVTAMLVKGDNCIGARVAEGWFSGRIGFDGGHRNIWGTRTALYAQLEITYTDGRVEKIASDASWTVKNGPIERAEIYDGERYDARLETPLWSNATIEEDGERHWEAVELLDPLPESTQLVTGFAEPVRRVETLRPIEKIITPTGKTILDFGQNIVGYLRIKHVKGPRGHKITLSHAEVLEHGELCTRPLRICKATDEYVLRGDEAGESYEPRFTFHGFRYAQIDDWPRQPGQDLGLDSIEAVVCRTDMPSVGHFECSDALLNKLYDNVCRSIRGNFLSVPTDCPQRDERLGWTGDIAIFAPTAVLLYDCHNILVNWLIDVEHDQRVLGGVPPMVSPNATLPDPKWCRRVPCAIWHDATILVPWALYEETGDARVLARQYDSMSTWMKVLPRGKEYLSHLWDPAPFQLGVRRKSPRRVAEEWLCLP